MAVRIHLAALLAGSVLMTTASIASATVYTSDPNLADFASATTNFATLSNFTAGDTSSPYATTFADLSAGLRVYAGGTLTGLPGSDWILATFSTPEAAIRVFPSIDHFGAAFDGYQYSIEGSNNGTTWTALFDATSVTGAGEPFTLGTFTGTAPVRVNNVLTPGAGPNGTVGYIADFDFATAYKFYAFGPSTEAGIGGNTDQELSGVSAPTAVPEPLTVSLFGAGLAGAAALGRRRRKNKAA